MDEWQRKDKESEREREEENDTNRSILSVTEIVIQLAIG